MKKLLILSYSPIDRDPRVDRQVRTLFKEYDLVVSGLTPPVGLETVPFVSLNKKDYVKKDYVNIAIGVRDFLRRYLPILVPPTKVLYRFLRQSVRLLRNGLGRYMRAIRGGGGHTRTSPDGGSRRNRKPVKLEWHESFHFKLARDRILALGPYDAILANDLTGLILVRNWGLEAPLIYDAHEYSPGQYAPDAAGREKAERAERFLRENLPHCDAVMTVCEGIAEEYAKEFGINKPVVVLNAPRYRDLNPSYNYDGTIRLVHHGIAGRLRRLEVLIDMMAELDSRFTLDFFLLQGDKNYYEELIHLADCDERIRFNNPVPMDVLPEVLNRYDIGLAFFPPLTINLKHVLPNKFFEFIQGRIGVAIGPSPEMSKYISKYRIGVISESFTASSIAGVLSKLTNEEIIRFKKNASLCAFELSGEVQAAITSKLVGETIAGSQSVRKAAYSRVELLKTVSQASANNKFDIR